jgi:hypothetical protein
MELILNEVQRLIKTASTGELLFGALLFLALIEQILYLFPVSYIRPLDRLVMVRLVRTLKGFHSHHHS